MKLNRISVLLLFLAVVFANVFLQDLICERVQQINCFFYETAYENMRNHNLPEELMETLLKASGGDINRYSELLTMYFATGATVTDVKTLEKEIDYVKKYRGEDFEGIRQQITALWQDLEAFPVGKISNAPEATVSFENSWMQSRTFGGDRGHEGTDIMASVNERGIYPVYSMTDGVVENIGWLRLGGYRIGVRSPSGAYFYYAHLAEYAREFEIGEEIAAGTLLGFMGDTGYSDVEGTTGNFAVHLHLGMYLNDGNGCEFSVNSYPMLVYLWEKQGKQLR